MKIDTEHLHYWMQAIRQSPDPMRTMDAFWQGQIKSKEWLIDNLYKHVDNAVSVDIYGGWVGVLASMMFQSAIVCKKIRSIDIDPSCQSIAAMMNKGEEIAGIFESISADMCEISSTADVVINTSCEHLTQEQYDRWLTNVSDKSLLVLQSNNYSIPEHIRIAQDIKEFVEQSKIDIIWKDRLDLPLYTRYMIIGKKR